MASPLALRIGDEMNRYAQQRIELGTKAAGRVSLPPAPPNHKPGYEGA